MCSTPEQRIAAFGRAIDDLASRARSEAPGAATPSAGETVEVPPPADGSPAVATGTDAAAPADVLSRLAELWAELATLDPEVAKRLPTYEA